MDLKSNRRSRRENEKYVEPPPLLVNLDDCKIICSSCGGYIDVYPQHTHIEHTSQFNGNTSYTCDCHKCAATFLWKLKYPQYNEDQYQAAVERRMVGPSTPYRS